MRQITFSDIKRRINYAYKDSNANYSHIVESARNISFNPNARPQDIRRLIESAIKCKADIPFIVYLELYESLASSKNSSISEVEKFGRYIAEEAVPKSRDAKGTLTLLHRRLGSMKSKISNKINKSMDNMYDAFKNKPITQSAPPVEKKQQAVEEAYKYMIENAMVMINCDRIIENYNSVSKRFNLEILFDRGTTNGAYDTVVELCKLMDTYNMPAHVKFNSIIETAYYGFESNGISYKKSDILEAAVDYFSFVENGRSICKEVLESTVIFDKEEDMGNIDVFTEEEPEEDKPIGIDEQIAYLTTGSIIKEAENNIKVEETDFDRMFSKFKKDELDKNPQGKLRNLINSLYSRSVSGIIEGTPNLLAFIRTFFIIGTATIPMVGPIIMLVGLIADRFISLHMERKEVEKMIKCFDSEIKKSKDKLSTLDNNEDKEKMKKYIKSLEDAREKIDNHMMNLLSDEEIDAKYNSDFNMDDDSFEGSDDDFDMDEYMKGMEDDDFDFDDDDFDFGDDGLLEAAYKMRSMEKSIRSFVERTSNIKRITEDTMYNIIFECDNDDDLINITTAAANYPEEFHLESVKSAINDYLYDIKNSKIVIETSVSRILRVSTLTNCLSIIAHTKAQPKPIYINEAKEYFDVISELSEAIAIMSNADKTRNTIMEASITNTLKMASMKLKQGIQKMTDKEKQISRNIDVNMNNFTKSVERALTTDNREAVIKGSILPSASKMLKLIIANAGLIAFGQPAAAIILTLGYFGCSAALKGKQRQSVIDEIEIELKMCQKYIEIAESKNDMKALKQLLSMQRDLERQLQRVKYKMKLDLGKKYFDTSNVKVD